MLSVEVTGDFSKTVNWFNRVNKANYMQILNNYGVAGVNALASATPKDSGLTSESWGYEIAQSQGSYSIIWTNSHIVNGIPIAVILQYGHGTNHGGYVEGRDYINPALRDIFDKIAEETWKVVSGS